MGYVVQRWKKLRLRWKLIPLVLLGGLIGFIWWARLPWYEIRMTEVVPYEGHPDWLEVRFEVENVSSEELEISAFENRAFADCVLFKNQSPTHMIYNMIPNFSPVLGSKEIAIVDSLMARFFPGETLRGKCVVHRELGHVEVVGDCFTVMEGAFSFHRKLRIWLGRFESYSWGISRSFNWQVDVKRFGLNLLFPPSTHTEPFVLNDEIKKAPKPLLSDSKAFVSKEIPEAFSGLSDAPFYQSLESYAEGENIEVPGNLEVLDNWDAENEKWADVSATDDEKRYFDLYTLLCQRMSWAMVFKRESEKLGDSNIRW